MIYSPAEILGMVALLLAFLGAGYAVTRLDSAIIGKAGPAEDDAGDLAAGTDAADVAATPAQRPHSSVANTSGARTASLAATPRRSRRKHGR
jgi:hypothetical protein